MRVRCDIETYSDVDLPKTGVYKYAASPEFRILMCAWQVDDGPVWVELDGDANRELFQEYWDAGAEFVAHNAQFERVCFSAWLGMKPGSYLDPSRFNDTQARAAEWGYPQSLEKCAVALGVSEKDSAGTRLINVFCKPNRKGVRTLPGEKPDEWLDFIAYCHQDVVTLKEIDEKLPDFPTEMEREVYIADQLVNDRGLDIDVPLAKQAVKTGRANEKRYKDRIVELSGGTVENPGSVQQMGKWLKEQGLTLPNLRAETVEEALSGDLEPVLREVLELRQELALTASKKFATALGAQVNGRLCGTLKFFGAHTGRWAGRGTQVQNLPRAAFETDVDQEMCIADLMAGEEVRQEDLKRLVRPMFLGPMTVVDYSAIEARVLAWLAGEQWTLDAFRAGRDIYVETAERMGGGMGRPEGKIAVLALGYNGAVGSLRAMGYGEGQPDSALLEIVMAWRQANPNIVQFWNRLERAFVRGGEVGDFLRVEKDGKDRFIFLPSGRPICYRKCSNSTGRITFASPQGYRADTYGGRLAENVTQAVARDLLAEALVRLRANGFRVLGHVHDEVLVEGDHTVKEVSDIMCDSPGWAKGLPVEGAGFTTNRYRKD